MALLLAFSLHISWPLHASSLALSASFASACALPVRGSPTRSHSFSFSLFSSSIASNVILVYFEPLSLFFSFPLVLFNFSLAFSVRAPVSIRSPTRFLKSSYTQRLLSPSLPYLPIPWHVAKFVPLSLFHFIFTRCAIVLFAFNLNLLWMRKQMRKNWICKWELWCTVTMMNTKHKLYHISNPKEPTFFFSPMQHYLKCVVVPVATGCRYSPCV